LHVVGLPLQSVDDLRTKYTEMLAMRLAHADGSENGAAVRTRMALLAFRFPGALRELDRLELAELRARILGLQSVVAGESSVEPWMVAVALFHELMRGALCAKRWLRREKRVGDARERAFAAELPNLEFPDDARVWLRDLGELAAPPGGRVTELVFARIALALGTDTSEVRRLVFGASSSTGRRGRFP
jgi:hypothetical protein